MTQLFKECVLPRMRPKSFELNRPSAVHPDVQAPGFFQEKWSIRDSCLTDLTVFIRRHMEPCSFGSKRFCIHARTEYAQIFRQHFRLYPWRVLRVFAYA